MTSFQFEILNFLYFALFAAVGLAKISLYVYLTSKIIQFIEDTWKTIKK